MPDKKLTDSEIKKALECCVSEQYTCSDCPYQEIKHYSDDEGFEIMPNGKRYDDWSCERWLNVDLLDLINRLQAENERLKEEKSKLENKIDEIYPLVMQLPNAMQQAKAEAYKEFAERLKGTFPQDDFLRSTKRISEDIDNLLKELVGENND